ncbi:MAG: hypothetical protein LBO80_09980 [Treponema sp.]|jgi:hypothetical protein|nr:hypothetical protein [Treponema sp.]
MRGLSPLLAALLFLWGSSLYAQTGEPAAEETPEDPSLEGGEERLLADPAQIIGLTLEGAIARFGVPKSVYPVRGLEVWQDDVVFEYEDRDLYVYRDRVWQVGLKTAYGISLGDRRAAALLALEEGYQNDEDHILFPLPVRGWPMTLRININAAGTVSALFVYRSDF